MNKKFPVFIYLLLLLTLQNLPVASATTALAFFQGLQQPPTSSTQEVVITAATYCSFLNSAAAAIDEHYLYNEAMGEDPNIACITRTGGPGQWHYEVIAGREDIPITYVNYLNKTFYRAAEIEAGLSSFPLPSSISEVDPEISCNGIPFSVGVPLNFLTLNFNNDPSDQRSLSRSEKIAAGVTATAILLAGGYKAYECLRNTSASDSSIGLRSSSNGDLVASQSRREFPMPTNPETEECLSLTRNEVPILPNDFNNQEARSTESDPPSSLTPGILKTDSNNLTLRIKSLKNLAPEEREKALCDNFRTMELLKKKYPSAYKLSWESKEDWEAWRTWAIDDHNSSHDVTHNSTHDWLIAGITRRWLDEKHESFLAECSLPIEQRKNSHHKLPTHDYITLFHKFYREDMSQDSPTNEEQETIENLYDSDLNDFKKAHDNLQT
ncbi:MAG: hypothetical protein ACH346_00815 [Chthoniobacterales bacterium]